MVFIVGAQVDSSDVAMPPSSFTIADSEGDPETAEVHFWTDISVLSGQC